MPIFKTNSDIFKYGSEESFDSIKIDSTNTFIPPLNNKWDYSKELDIKDVELWEVIYEEGNEVGVYVAWEPYAEFYMIRKQSDIFFYYGRGALKKAIKKMKEFGIPVNYNAIWVEKEDMWLYV
jgi:hypothetical protein